ncbi:MAG: hypothetical protein QNK37_30000 [Acidobacteriota bacterium]|nr:hypothetical protein [Acidobacteriota bacterium]
MTSKKLALNELKVKSFPTNFHAGIEVIGVEHQHNTVYSGICTCLLPCGTERIYSCPNGCPRGEVEEIEQRWP